MFLTRLDFIQCSLCGKSNFVVKAGNSMPYNDYSCTKCDWTGKVCFNCAKNNPKCPVCGEKIESVIDKIEKKLSKGVMV